MKYFKINLFFRSLLRILNYVFYKENQLDRKSFMRSFVLAALKKTNSLFMSTASDEHFKDASYDNEDKRGLIGIIIDEIRKC